jgi:cytochrome c-type biogenesis protein CcmH/NrfF
MRSTARALCSLMLALGVMLVTMGASDIAGRYNALSHQMMCTCGCAQLLGECNHVGCPNSPGMLAALHTDLAGGMSDHAVLVDFEHKYGPTALASPMLTRFNQAAWVVPPAVLILGILGALLLLRRWREDRLATQPAASDAATAPLTPQQAAARARTLAQIRRETE